MAEMVILLILSGGIVAVFGSMRRNPSEVLWDLKAERCRSNRRSQEIKAGRQGIVGGDLWNAGFVTRAERRSFLFKQRMYNYAGGAGGIICAFAMGLRGWEIPAASVIGVALGYAIRERRRAHAHRVIRSKVESALPLVVERVIMAVQAGLDVIPALRAVTEENANKKTEHLNRILQTVHALTEEGATFEEALTLVGSRTEIPALRHVFVHLALAHKVGGELVAPLRELGDATQLQFQESAEEVIATLPVRATAPLVCVFAGLLILLLTVPVLEVVSVAGRAQSLPQDASNGGMR